MLLWLVSLHFLFDADSMWLVYENGYKLNRFHESAFTLSYAYQMKYQICNLKKSKENNQKKYN